MRNPLTSLDELIWRQYEKVTQKAAKLGYSKYDLMYLCDVGAAVSFTGNGSYTMLEGILGGSALATAFGAACAIIGGLYYKASKITTAETEERDTRALVQYGAVPPPQFTGIRPLHLGMAVYLVGLGAYTLIREDIPVPSTFQKLSPSDYATLKGLAELALSAFGAGVVSASYFLDQTPLPPQKKFWQAWYEKLAARFQKPAEVPAVKYQIIDLKISS
jgi:hypothetical protein